MPMPMPQEVEPDALTQLCQAGVEQAATALSRLLGRPVRIEPPRLLLLDPASPAGYSAARVIGLSLHILGEVAGSFVILLNQGDAGCLLELLLGEPASPVQPLSELETATLKEVGNILASACLNRLAVLLKMTLLPSIPGMECGLAGDVLSHALGHLPGSGALLAVETAFSISAPPCSGSIFLIPAAASLDLISGRLGAS
jgi:chemotaxis protein CheC